MSTTESAFRKFPVPVGSKFMSWHMLKHTEVTFYVLLIHLSFAFNLIYFLHRIRKAQNNQLQESLFFKTVFF